MKTTIRKAGGKRPGKEIKHWSNRGSPQTRRIFNALWLDLNNILELNRLTVRLLIFLPKFTNKNYVILVDAR